MVALMTPLANALPEGTGDGYVAAAYIVFFVLLLIYVAIMALRLSRVQRDLRELQTRTESVQSRSHESSARDIGEDPQAAGGTAHTGATASPPAEHEREREPA